MRKTVAILAVIIALAPVNSVSAKTISEEQKGVISANCSSIKFRLQKVQKDGPKSRVHLGAQYEALSTGLMMNLNLRLVKNDLANADIASQQSDFAAEREQFKQNFISYSQGLDDLLNIDCRAEPQKFYDKLEKVREKRGMINESISRINKIIKTHRESIVQLKEALGE